MGRCEKWTISYRLRNGNSILPEDLMRPFTPLSGHWRYWYADPFLVEDGQKTWLFAELYDRLRLKGILACCELTANGAGKWRVILDEPFHLSYPFVFRKNDQWYMIPESLGAKRIILYRATEFPWKWEKAETLAPIGAVDSTLLQTSDGSYLVTSVVENGVGRLAVLKLDDSFSSASLLAVADEENPNTRSAGGIISHNGILIRPTQDCTAGYGAALNFMKILSFGETGLREELMCKVLPGDITINGVTAPEGIHTYNCTGTFEVIDHKEYEFGLLSKIGGVIRRIKKHLRRY